MTQQVYVLLIILYTLVAPNFSAASKKVKGMRKILYVSMLNTYILERIITRSSEITMESLLKISMSKRT